MMATFEKYLRCPVWVLWVLWWVSALMPKRFRFSYEWISIGAAIEEKTARARRENR